MVYLVITGWNSGERIQMNTADARGYLRRHVKIAPHANWQHWSVGILQSVDGENAKVLVKAKGDRPEAEITVPVPQLKRWARGEQIDSARTGAIGVAATAAEIVGENISRAAGIPTVKTRDILATPRLMENLPKHSDSFRIDRNSETGALRTNTPTLKSQHGATICELHGNDEPCGDCKAAADARAIQPPTLGGGRLHIPEPETAQLAATEEKPSANWGKYGSPTIILDQISGRVWCGPDRGFVDGTKNAEEAIQWARRMTKPDARRWVSVWISQPGKRSGGFYPSGLVAVTTDEAVNILTDPKRTFKPLLAPHLMPKPGEMPAAAHGSNGASRKVGDEAETIVDQITALAGQVADASRTLKKAEESHTVAKIAADAAMEAANVAKQHADRLDREARAYREALGSLKAEMMRVIESQG
jgi:hypothetical protein